MENRIYKLGIQNVVFSVLAQGCSFVLSIVTGFVLPSLMGVTQYGYWQVYLFYAGYIMIFCFGFNDGLYLRYGNLDYRQLPFDRLRTAMRIFILITSILVCFLFGLSVLENDKNKVFALCAASINLLLLGVNGTLLTILQITNQIKLNSILTIANKALFIVFIIPLLLFKWADFKLFIILDIVTKLILLGANMYKLKELFIGHSQNIAVGFTEYLQDVEIGIKLMLANIMSTLLVGIGRFIVERFMSLESYSLYSFATTITSFALLFIGSASLAMYPLLIRITKDKLPVFYKDINTLLCAGLFLLLAVYFPLYYLISNYFNDYVGIFEYFYLLFIVIVSQGKMQFLNNTYYKVLREEKAMLYANVSGVVMALMLIVPLFFYTHSVFSIVLGTSLALIWRCYASEIFLKKKLGIHKYSNIVIELVMMVIFILCSSFSKIIYGFSLYMFAVCIFVYMHRSVIRGYSNNIFILAFKR